MTAVTVGTTPVVLDQATGRGRPIIQNLGPGNVYFDSEPTVTASTGIRLVPGAAFEFATGVGVETGLSVVADQANTDVRVIVMGV